MKYFKKILKNTSLGIAATLFTGLSGFAQYKTNISHNINSIKLSTGIQIWKDKDLKNAYGDMFTFKANYQRGLKMGLDLETSLNFFIPKKEYTDKEKYKLTNFAINLGLSKDIFLSDDGNVGIYLNGGLKYALMTEEVKIRDLLSTRAWSEETEKGSALGYFLGAGLEKLLMPGIILFFEANLNETQIEMYGKNLNISGNELMIGMRLF